MDEDTDVVGNALDPLQVAHVSVVDSCDEHPIVLGDVPSDNLTVSECADIDKPNELSRAGQQKRPT
ncbi:hypothetical protein E2C01_026554 [Portunus trituberculatus]|uniref:Uncharacterized protein n=1 Tax=Portunus trituberculatus TaxID=210409 RepID=A0A5B7EFP7_PORTR|nr:hypothetical protein [Portunus trituberculatus]